MRPTAVECQRELGFGFSFELELGFGCESKFELETRASNARTLDCGLGLTIATSNVSTWLDSRCFSICTLGRATRLFVWPPAPASASVEPGRRRVRRARRLLLAAAGASGATGTGSALRRLGAARAQCGPVRGEPLRNRPRSWRKIEPLRGRTQLARWRRKSQLVGAARLWRRASGSAAGAADDAQLAQSTVLISDSSRKRALIKGSSCVECF